MKTFHVLDYSNGELIKITSNKGIHEIFDTLGLKETNCLLMDGKLMRSQKKNQLSFSDIIKNYKFIERDISPETSCIVLYFGTDTLKQNIEAVVTISTFGKINYAYKENGSWGI